MIDVDNHVSDWSAPDFRRIWFVVLDPTVVKDDQAFWPWFVVVGVAPSLLFCSSLRQASKAIIIASTKRPAYARKNLQVVQVNPIRILSTFIMIWCCIHDGCVWSTSFVIYCMMDTRCIIFVVEDHWYKYFSLYWSYGNLINDGSSVPRQLMLGDCLFCTNLSTMSTLFDPCLVKLQSKTKSSFERHMFGPHLVEVHSVTKSSDKGYISYHIWSKSAVRQSPPMRGTFWTTFSQSPQWDKVLQHGAHYWTTFGWIPQCDKVLQWGAHFGPHLVKVRSETIKVHSKTKSSDEGHIIGPHLV